MRIDFQGHKAYLMILAAAAGNYWRKPIEPDHANCFTEYTIFG